MSRTAHPRPAKAAQDAAARVTSAAIGVADAYTRFQREMARLQRSIADAHTEGLHDTDVLAAVRTAARGRADRAEALQTIVERQRLHDPGPAA